MSFIPPSETPPVVWSDFPSTASALGAANLNAEEVGLIGVVMAVITAYDSYVQSIYATLASANLTGNPTAATNPLGTNDNSIATMSDVQLAIQTVLAAGATSGGAPVNLSPPVISNLSPHSGDILTAVGDLWTNTPTSRTWQWRNSPDGVTWTNITTGTGFNAVSYTAQAGDVGKVLDVVMTATTASLTSIAATSAPTGIVTSSSVAAPVNNGPGFLPAISGTTTQGQTLTATPGTWTGSPTFSYQWARRLPTDPPGVAGTHITGATSSTYVQTAADVGNVLYVIVTGSNAGGTGLAYSTSTSTATTSSGGGGGGGTLLWSPSITVGALPIKSAPTEFVPLGTEFTGSDVIGILDPLGSGVPVFKFAIANTDRPSTNKPRADLLSGTGIVEGSSVFVSMPIYLPASVVGGVNDGLPIFGGGGSNFCQWAECKDTIGGPPTWGLYIQGITTGGVLQQSFVLRSGSTGAVYWHTPVNNAWHTAVLSGVWSRSVGTGFFNMWWDGNPVTFTSTGTTTLNIATLGSSSPQVGAGNQPIIINSYRAADFYTGTMTTYHGKPKIGTTLASVLPDSGLPQGP